MKDIEIQTTFRIDLEDGVYYEYTTHEDKLRIKLESYSVSIEGDTLDKLRGFLNYIKAKQQ